MEPKQDQKPQARCATARSWVELFATEAGGAGAGEVRFRVLRKHGEPLLVLPTNNHCAAQAMALYPAQTAVARVVRSLVRAMFAAGVPPVCEDCRVTLAPGQPFPRFLRELAGSDSLPPLAILNGNPRQVSRRFVLLVFSPGAKPPVVVKAGIGQPASELIRKEVTFLKSLLPRLSGIPVVRGEFASGEVCAFATDFVPGDCPRETGPSRVAELLRAWLDRSRTLAVGELPQWQRLQRACANDPLFIRLERKLAGERVHPTTSHGDLAPWNIKLAKSSAWVVLDWERGELNGLPAWDWFHFVIQPELLVRRRTPARIAADLRTFLTSPAFRAYAEAARISGLEQALLAAYLAYSAHVIRPSEGLQATEELLKLIAEP